MTRTPLAALVLITAAFTASAQELTLDKAVQTALESNPALRSAREKAQAAAAKARQAKGHRLPSLDLSETYERTDNPAEVFALTLNQGRFDLQKFFTADPNNPKPLDSYITRLELTQPIYTGGKLSARISQADAMASAADHDRRRTVHQVSFDTITAYVNLAKAREQVQLMDKVRETTARHLSLAESYARQGIVLEAEVLKAKVYLSHMEDLEEQARNMAALAESALNFQMGVDQAIPRTLAALPPPPTVGGGLDEMIVGGLDRRQDLAAARMRLTAGRLGEKVARASFLPEVAAIGRYDLYDDTLFGDHGSSSAVLAVAKINLFRGGSDAAARAAARHDAASFADNIEHFENGVRLDVRQAWQDLDTARNRLATAADGIGAAREAMRVREERFRQGLDRMIDLLDAETQLRETEVRELTARYDVTLASYKLLFASGAPLIQTSQETEESR